MKGIGKVYFTFEDIKKIGNLPEDALLKQYTTDALDDTVEIQFYSDEVVKDCTGIRRERLTKNTTLNINVDKLVDEISNSVIDKLNDKLAKVGAFNKIQ